jgi:hypothetical protein
MQISLMILFELAIVLIVSVTLKTAGDVLCKCVESEPSFFGMFRIPKHLWWHAVSFYLTYNSIIMVMWIMFGACGEQKDMACASACIKERVNAIKTLLAHQYDCSSVTQPMIKDMLIDGYWH